MGKSSNVPQGLFCCLPSIAKRGQIDFSLISFGFHCICNMRKGKWVLVALFSKYYLAAREKQGHIAESPYLGSCSIHSYCYIINVSISLLKIQLFAVRIHGDSDIQRFTGMLLYLISK